MVGDFMSIIGLVSLEPGTFPNVETGFSRKLVAGLNTGRQRIMIMLSFVSDDVL